MAVDTPSADYLAHATKWRRARDCVAGSDAVKEAGTTYLPALAGHEDGRNEDYRAYRDRALFYNASGRTIDGLTGMVFRREPVIEAPPGAEDLVDDVDLMGQSLAELSRHCLREVLTEGRCGVLADHVREGSDQPRPYMRVYTTEDILDVVEDVVGGAVVPVQVRLHEAFVEPDPDDEFEVVEVEQVRVLELVDGVHQQRVYRRTATDVGSTASRRTQQDAWELSEVVRPTINGAPMDRIPFWILSADSAGRPARIDLPPLLDLFDVNLAHYRSEADYRNALHMAGVPTLCVSGMDAPDDPVKVGSAEVFFLPPADAKAYFVSYGADGAAAIRQSLDDLQQMMAFLGARMLQPEKRGIEAAETARIHRMGEVSVLGAIVNGLSTRLTQAWRLMLTWALFDEAAVDEAKVELNSDFMPSQAPAQTLTAMIAAWQANAISHDSLWAYMQEGELVDPRRTIEDEQTLIDARPKPKQPVSPNGAAIPPQPPQQEGEQPVENQ